MDQVEEVEGALFELAHEHQLRVNVSDCVDVNALGCLFDLLVTYKIG